MTPVLHAYVVSTPHRRLNWWQRLRYPRRHPAHLTPPTGPAHADCSCGWEGTFPTTAEAQRAADAHVGLL